MVTSSVRHYCKRWRCSLQSPIEALLLLCALNSISKRTHSHTLTHSDTHTCFWPRWSPLCLHMMLISLLWKGQMSRSAAHQRGQRSCGAAQSWMLKVLSFCRCGKPLPVFFLGYFFFLLGFSDRFDHLRHQWRTHTLQVVMFLFFVLIHALLWTQHCAWFRKMKIKSVLKIKTFKTCEHVTK